MDKPSTPQGKPDEAQEALEAMATLADDFGLPLGTTVAQVANHARFLQQERARLLLSEKKDIFYCEADEMLEGRCTVQCDECVDIERENAAPQDDLKGSEALHRPLAGLAASSHRPDATPAVAAPGIPSDKQETQ